MTRYLLDTNILLRACDRAAANHSLAVEAVSQLLARGDECAIASQVLIEFWTVATRSLEFKGLGWSPERTSMAINQLLVQFSMLDETPQLFTYWWQLVATYKIRGKRTHDIRLLAAMKANEIKHLLTFNPGDFPETRDIAIVHPQELV